MFSHSHQTRTESTGDTLKMHWKYTTCHKNSLEDRQLLFSDITGWWWLTGIAESHHLSQQQQPCVSITSMKECVGGRSACNSPSLCLHTHLLISSSSLRFSSTRSYAKRILELLIVKGTRVQDLLELVAGSESGLTLVGLEATLQGTDLTAPKTAEHTGTQAHGFQWDTSWKKDGSSQILTVQHISQN